VANLNSKQKLKNLFNHAKSPAAAKPPGKKLPSSPKGSNGISLNKKLAPTPTHASMEIRFRKIGMVIAQKAKGKKTNPIRKKPIIFKDGVFKRVKPKISRKDFGKEYRSDWPNQDELISTSSVREIIYGIFSSLPAKPSQAVIDEISASLDNISLIRLRTAHSGFATKVSVMQHPTAKGAGFFSNASTSSLHSLEDLNRKIYICKAMEDEIGKKSCTPESITRAGIRAAIEFTLNKFTAPRTAKNVNPFAVKKIGQQQISEQVQAREELKKIYVSIGGMQEQSSNTSLSRSWRDCNRRAVSAPRK